MQVDFNLEDIQQPRPRLRAAKSSRPDFAKINAAALAACPGLLESWFPAGRLQGREFCVGNLQGDAGESLKINVGSGVWKDFATDQGGSDLVSLYAALHSMQQAQAARALEKELSLSTPRAKPKPAAKAAKQEPRRIVASYDYHDAAGNVVYQVTRWEPKSFTQRRTDGQGGWINNMQGVELVPFNLPAVLAADEVFITEGEKDAIALNEMGLTATTNAQGAGKWRDSYTPHFQGKHVVILPDNDEPGRDHAAKVAAALHGIAASVKMVELPGLPAKGDVSDWLAAGGTLEALQALVQAAPDEGQHPPSCACTPDPWAVAREMFPRIEYPWEVLPGPVADSLKQLARSCATSPTSLPGHAACILGACVGNRLAVKVKPSWQEPLIFWHADVRESGAGKTSVGRKLLRELETRQESEYRRFADAVKARAAAKKEERGEEPKPPRGYFATNMTLEGLRQDLDEHPTGGLLIMLDELSALITSQNQYKKAGNDRETWLTLHDGNSARFLRQSKTLYLPASRVSVSGGIQPAIFKRAFSSEDGQFLVDGTIFRLLTVFEPNAFHELTAESWTKAAPWLDLTANALAWADRQEGQTCLPLTSEAREHFLQWRNEIVAAQPDLPQLLRGYVPKAVGYAVRLAGVLQVAHDLNYGPSMSLTLDRKGIQRGIDAAMFYMGQAVDAVRLLLGENPDCQPKEDSERSRRLAVVLADLKEELCNGRLAVGFVTEKYNHGVVEAEHLSAHALGALVRACGLTIGAGKHDANGRRGAKCLVWDEAAESFSA